MEPLDDQELNNLLKEWKAPGAPASLKRRVLPQPLSPWKSPWQWLVKGSIRVPVPVGIAAIVVLALWFFLRQPAQPPVVQAPPGSTLAGFRPVEQLEPTLVEKADDTQQQNK